MDLHNVLTSYAWLISAGVLAVLGFVLMQFLFMGIFIKPEASSENAVPFAIIGWALMGLSMAMVSMSDLTRGWTLEGGLCFMVAMYMLVSAIYLMFRYIIEEASGQK